MDGVRFTGEPSRDRTAGDGGIAEGPATAVGPWPAESPDPVLGGLAEREDATERAVFVRDMPVLNPR